MQVCGRAARRAPRGRGAGPEAPRPAPGGKTPPARARTRTRQTAPPPAARRRAPRRRRRARGGAVLPATSALRARRASRVPARRPGGAGPPGAPGPTLDLPGLKRPSASLLLSPAPDAERPPPGPGYGKRRGPTSAPRTSAPRGAGLGQVTARFPQGREGWAGPGRAGLPPAGPSPGLDRGAPVVPPGAAPLLARVYPDLRGRPPAARTRGHTRNPGSAARTGGHTRS